MYMNLSKSQNWNLLKIIDIFNLSIPYLNSFTHNHSFLLPYHQYNSIPIAHYKPIFQLPHTIGLPISSFFFYWEKNRCLSNLPLLSFCFFFSSASFSLFCISTSTFLDLAFTASICSVKRCMVCMGSTTGAACFF